MRLKHPLVTGIKSILLMALLSVLIYAPLISRIRQQYIDSYVDCFEKNMANESVDAPDEIDVPDTDIFAIEGEEDIEEGEQDMSLLIEETDSGNAFDDYQKKDSKLKLIGIIEIPSIDTKVPVWDGVSIKALRFGVGRYPLSAELGSDKGDCFIMGHRNRHLSTIFCRLQNVKVGDQVLVTTKDGRDIEYKVSNTFAVPPESITEYMNTPKDAPGTLTLCTCLTERGKGWRFIAQCTKSEF